MHNYRKGNSRKKTKRLRNPINLSYITTIFLSYSDKLFFNCQAINTQETRYKNNQ